MCLLHFYSFPPSLPATSKFHTPSSSIFLAPAKNSFIDNDQNQPETKHNRKSDLIANSSWLMVARWAILWQARQMDCRCSCSWWVRSLTIFFILERRTEVFTRSLSVSVDTQHYCTRFSKLDSTVLIGIWFSRLDSIQYVENRSVHWIWLKQTHSIP